MGKHFIVLALGLASTALASAPKPGTVTAGLTALQAQDLRVATIAYRLATRGAPLCRTLRPWSGMLVQDLGQYSVDARPVAGSLFHLDRGPAVEAVVAGGPAANAGVVEGDRLLAVNGEAPADLATTRARTNGDYAGMAALLAQLRAAFARGPVVLTLEREKRLVTATVRGTPGCASDVQLVPGSKQNASADGSTVILSTAIAVELDDIGLAFLIAHEMSHNILGHRARLDEQGVTHGLFSGMGGNAAAIRRTEEEADYHALFLMRRAGFDADAVAPVWRSFQRAHGPGFLADATHLNGEARVRFLDLTAAQIAALEVAGGSIMPDLTTVPALATRARSRAAETEPAKPRSGR